MNLEALEKIKEEYGISQNEMARRIGISIANMSNIATGKREPRADVLKRICDTFGRQPNDLL